MKSKLLFGFGILCISLSMFSCKKDHNNDGLSDDIKNFVPQAIIDSMRVWGMNINEGKTPPSINGIYVFSPNYCTFDNSGDDRAGDVFNDYKYMFYNQDNNALTIKVKFKNMNSNSDSASGEGAFLSGTGNSFTAFVDVNGVSDGITYNSIYFYSGEITSSGISHFQKGFYMKSKGDDPNDQLVDVGTSRIFTDQDDLAGTAETYRVVNPVMQVKPNDVGR